MNQEKYLVLLIVTFYTLLAVNLFELSGVLYFHCLIALMACFVKLKLQQTQENGLIHYMPPLVRSILTEHSIFDLLCNVWFSQQLSLLLKGLAMPFLVSVTREEAYALIEEANPKLASILATEGIANILPASIRSLLHPKLERPRKQSGISTEVPEEDSVGVIQVEAPKIKRSKKFSARQPVLQQVFSYKLRHFLSLISNRTILLTSLTGGVLLILQLVLFRRVRVWSVTGLKMMLFAGSFGSIGLSFIVAFIRYLHKRYNAKDKQPPVSHFPENFDALHPLDNSNY